MPDNVWINADKSAVVDQFHRGKKYQVSRKEALRMGLLPPPSQVRRASAPPKPAPEAPSKPQRRRKRK